MTTLQTISSAVKVATDAAQTATAQANAATLSAKAATKSQLQTAIDAGAANQARQLAEDAVRGVDNRIYPGTFAAPPVTRPDGTTIQPGDIYTSDTGVLFQYLSGAWTDYNGDAQAAAAAADADRVAAQTAAGNAAADRVQTGLDRTQTGLDRVATAADVVSAEAAKAAAELAAQASLIQGGVYVDEPTGRAAVADGVAFKVQGTGNVAAFEYRRVNSGASTLIATYPSRAFMEAAITARTMFAVGNSVTFSFTAPATIGWAVMRFYCPLFAASAGPRRTADRAAAALPEGSALVIDLSADAVPPANFAVSEVVVTSTLLDEVTQGRKLLLAYHYPGGNLMGVLVPYLLAAANKAATTTAQAAAVTADGKAVTADGKAVVATNNALRGRKLVAGRILYEKWASTILTVTCSEGRVWKENNSGTYEAMIAPFGPQSLVVGEGMVVDLVGGALDGQGRRIPTKVLIGAGSGTGWQSDEKYVLVANSYDGVTAGEYRKSYDTLGRIAWSDERSTYLYSADTPTASVSVGWSGVRFYAGGSVPKIIADRALAPLPSGDCLYINMQDATNPLAVYQGLITDVAIEAYSGQLVMLAGNYSSGYLVGELASRLALSKKISSNEGVALARKLVGGRITQADWNGTQVTVTVTEGRSYKQANSGALEKRIAPVVGEVLLEGQGLVVDLAAGAVDGDGRYIPTKLYVAQSAATGWQTADKYILVANIGNTTIKGEYEPSFAGSAPTSGWQSDEVVIVQRSDEVDIYIKGSNPATAKYLRHRMQRKPNAGISSDVWRWNEVWEADRIGEFAFTPTLQLANGGEVETAIKQIGKTDFMGGTAHGEEEFFAVAMLIDGVNVPLGGVGQFRGRRVEFVQGSDMYEVDTAIPKSNRVAKNYKRWSFAREVIDLYQYIVWEDSLTLTDCYMTMLPWLRLNGPTQISDKAYRAPLYAVEDISTTGFVRVYDKTNNVKVSGPNGHSAEVRILKGWDKPNRRFNISETETYNKLYFEFCGNNYVTQVGEIMDVHAQFIIDTRN